MWETDFTGGTVVVLGAEGRGLRPLVRRTCDAAVSIPLAGDVESLNVSVAAALLLYEARQPAWLTRRSTSSTGTTSSTRAPSRTGASCATRWRASSPCAARAGCSSSTAAGRTRRFGSLAVRFAAHADTLIERLASENRDTERVCVVVLGRDDPRDGRPPGADVDLADLPRRGSPQSSTTRASAPSSPTGSTRRRATRSSACAAGRLTGRSQRTF